MTEDRPDCPVCGVKMDLGDRVEEPDDGGPATYFYTCGNDDCPESKHWVNDLPDNADRYGAVSDTDTDTETMLRNADLSDGGDDGGTP